MSDAVRLYTVIESNLNKLLPEMLEENRSTLAMLITGILRSKKGQLDHIARAVWYAFRKPSLVDRFRRFVRNKNIVVEVEFNPFALLFLAALNQEQQILLIDSTKIGGGCMCLMLSVYYKSRALPLVWLVYKGKKGHSGQETQLALFKTARELLPPDSQVIVLGDGEFDGSQLVQWFEQQATWQYVCRADASTLIWYQEQWVALNQLPLVSGQGSFLTGVKFTQAHQVGPLNILVVWNEAKQVHWFFVTNFATQKEAQHWYRKRFTIETLFSDVKGRGFRIQQTRLKEPERVSRLILAAAMAYIFTVFWGVEAIISGDFRRLVRTDAFYHSLFQLGLIYLEHLLNESSPFPDLTHFPAPPTFEHVVIS
jgi:hypothetical protein